MDRQEKIKSLLGQVGPLNQRRIYLETKLNVFAKKDIDPEKQEELEKDRQELNDLYVKLRPLFDELRNPQCKYEVIYEGELFDPPTNQNYWNRPEREILFLQTCCTVDTIQNGWRPYINDNCVNNVIIEV